MEERIKVLRKALSLSQSSFGQALGVSRDVINNIERGRNKAPMSNMFISHLCTTFGVSERWLRTGEGEMFIVEDNILLEKLQKEYNLSDTEFGIIEKYLQLSSSERALFVQTLNTLTSNSD